MNATCGLCAMSARRDFLYRGNGERQQAEAYEELRKPWLGLGCSWARSTDYGPHSSYWSELVPGGLRCN